MFDQLNSATLEESITQYTVRDFCIQIDL